MGAAALSLTVFAGLGMYVPAVAVEPTMTEGTPLPQLPDAPFAVNGLSSASSSFVAVNDYQPEEGVAAKLMIHRISDGALVRTVTNPSPGGQTEPRLEGQSIVQLSESTYQGGLDTLTTTDVDTGTAATLSFDAKLVGYGPGWVLTCSADGSTDNCPIRLRTAAGVNTLVGVAVDSSQKISEADGDETRAVVSTPSGDQWAINTVTGSAVKLAYPEARAVAGGRAFWTEDEYVDGVQRTRLHWSKLDGTGEGSVLVDAPSYEYDFRAFGDRVALLRVPDDGDASHKELRPVNLTTGALEPRVAHSITGMRSLADGKVVLALGDTPTGRIAELGDDGQPPRTVFTMTPIGRNVDQLLLSGGQLAATWMESGGVDQDLYFTTAHSSQPWSTTGPNGIAGKVDHQVEDQPQYSGGVVVTDASGSSTSSTRTYKLAWPGGSRTVTSASGSPILGTGGTLVSRNVSSGGSIQKVEVQSTKSGVVKAALTGDPAFTLDGTWIWSFASGGTVLKGWDTASSETRRHEFPAECSDNRSVEVVGTWALVSCDGTGSYVLDLTSTAGAWPVPLASGDRDVRLGGGYVTWIHYEPSGDSQVPVIKVASLEASHETRTYGPSRGLSFPPGPTLAPDDAGLPSMAYVDSHHQPRLLDLSWTDTLAPVITTADVSPTISGTPDANATFTFAGSDSASPVTYSVAYRTHGSAGFGDWVEPASWGALPGPSVSRKITSGTTTCFRVRAHDASGHTSDWSASYCSTSPLDDRLLSAHGSVTRGKNASAMSKTESVLRKKGASLVRSSQQFHDVYVYAWRGPNEGGVKVYAGATYLGTLSLKNSKSGYVRLLVKSTQARDADVRLVSSSTKRARIDGIALMP